MTRLRHRLPPIFYLGLFPVLILLWAWADSACTAWTRSASAYSERLFRWQARLRHAKILATLPLSPDSNSSLITDH